MGRSTGEIAERLRRHLANGDRITGVVQLSGGHSNETYLVEGLDQILRMPPAGAVLLEQAFDVAGQHEIIQELGRTPGAPPVPVITFFDPSGEVLGAPAFLMERLPGRPWSDWNAPEWALGRPQSFLAGISEQAIDALVALHGLAPLKAFGTVRSSGEELERWRRSLDGIELSDRVVQLFDQLLSAVPPLDRPAPCHGDPKLPNMLWDEGRLTAVLDWELGFNGDPRWDISYAMMPFASSQHPAFPGFDTPGLWQADRMAAEWSQRAGRTTDRLQWFEAANFMKITAIHIYGANLFARGQTDDVRFKAFADFIDPGLNYAEALWQIDGSNRK